MPEKLFRRRAEPLALNRRTFVLAGLTATAVAPVITAGAATPAATGDGAVDTIVEAVAAMPGGLAFDGIPGGYEAFEFTLLTGACLIRNPYVTATDDPNSLTQDLYDWEGVLAESYDVSEDGLTYTFHLRQGVMSPAGNELTADDVLWSYERKWNSTSIAPLISLPAITDPATQLKKVDQYTVTWTVAEAGHAFPLLAVISKISGEIYDSTLLKSKATADDPYAVDWSNTNTEGSYGFGPYVLDSYEDGVQIVYKASATYALGEPAIKTITQKVVADAGNRASLLKNGDVDVAVQLLPADVDAMSSVGDLTTYDVATNNFTWIFLQTDTPPFDDKLVRQALFKAVPYQQIMDVVYHGKAKPVVGLLDPAAPEHVSTGLLEQEYDPEGAKALLAQAGVTGPVSYTISCSSAVPDMQEVAVQIQSFGQDAGFDVKIEVLPPATLYEHQTAQNFQLLLMRDMAVSYESPPYVLNLAYPRDLSAGTTGWGPQEYFDAVDAGGAAGDALGKPAAEAWNKAELIWQDGRPQIQVCNVTPLMVMSSKLTGFAHRTDNVIDFSIVKPA
jgi:peptide/nickel transport system substrate-binding protein